MLRRAELLMFDLDGTLVDSTPDIAQSANYVRRYFSLPPLPVATIRDYIGNGTWFLLHHSLDGIAGSMLVDGHDLFKRHYTQHCTDFTWIYPGCAEMLRALQNRKIAVVTNKPDAMSKQVLAAYGLIPLIGLLVGGDSAPKKKPAPEHLQQALQWADCSPDQALMIGDSSNDIEAALAAGVPFCGVTYGIGKPIGGKGEKPDFTIEHPMQLLEYLA